MLELDRDLAGKVVTQVQAALNIQCGILKIGLGPQQHLCPVGFRLRIQVAYFFTIEHQIMEVQLRIDGWRFKRSGPGNMKIRFAGHGEPLRLKTVEVSQLNIFAAEVEAKNFVEELISCHACELSAVMRKQDVVELDFATGKVDA